MLCKSSWIRFYFFYSFVRNLSHVGRIRVFKNLELASSNQYQPKVAIRDKGLT